MNPLFLSPIDNATTLNSAIVCIAVLIAALLYLYVSSTCDRASRAETKGLERLIVFGVLIVWASAICAAMKLLTPIAIAMLGLSELEKNDPKMAFLAAFAAASLIAMVTSKVIRWIIWSLHKKLRNRFFSE